MMAEPLVTRLGGLERKGWKPAEIERTKRILERAEEKKTPIVSFMDTAVYWIALILAIVGNMILSVILVPFLLIMTDLYLLLTLIVLGLSFGTLFKILIDSIERLQKQHYIVASLFIPSIALVNIYVMTYLSNRLIPLLELKTALHSPVVVSVVYVFAFTLPYVISQRRANRKHL